MNTPIDDPVAAVEQHFGIRLQPATRDNTEYRSVSGCPECGDGGKGSRSDRFRLFTDGSPRYWCRKCGFQGFVDEINGTPWRDLDTHERRRRMISAEIRKREEAEKQAKIRKAALRELRSSNAAAEYHRALRLSPRGLNYWFGEGFTSDTIQRFQLGYCEECPMDIPEHRPSVTIPVYSGGKLFDIRHRILDASNSDKYRPHLPNLPMVLFNADNLFSDSWYILIVEGEKKSMMASQQGWVNVGIMGVHKFPEDTLVLFAPFRKVIVALDPDAWSESQRIAGLFGKRGVARKLPDKLDDLLNPRKGNKDPKKVFSYLVGSEHTGEAREEKDSERAVARF